MCTKFGTVVGVADVITFDRLFAHQLKVVDSVRGRKLPFFIDKASLHYQRADATTQPVIHEVSG